MPAGRKQQPLEPLTKRLFPLTPTDTEILTALAGEMTDRIGRTIGASAVVRALVRLAGKRTVTGETLAEQIEQELNSGRQWGSKKRK